MKKILLLMLALTLISGCNYPTEVKNNTKIIKNEPQEPPIEQKPTYNDENPIEISLYLDNEYGGLSKVNGEYHTPWILKKDIAVFGALLTNEDQTASGYFQNIWSNYATSYENINYKLAWHLKFSLSDGTTIDKNITKPSDTEEFYSYLEIYLYDSANAPIGQFYSHLLDEQMTEDTILTSMKLTSGEKLADISSPIEVSAYTYDTEDDFNESNEYRGKSIYKVIVYND